MKLVLVLLKKSDLKLVFSDTCRGHPKQRKQKQKRYDAHSAFFLKKIHKNCHQMWNRGIKTDENIWQNWQNAKFEIWNLVPCCRLSRSTFKKNWGMSYERKRFNSIVTIPDLSSLLQFWCEQAWLDVKLCVSKWNNMEC